MVTSVIGYGAQANVQKNLVVGNSYTGTSAASGGILVFGGACYGGNVTTGIEVQQNILVGNDVGVWFSNLDGSCNSVSTPTRDQANNNTIRNNAVNNPVYQAGVSDQGDFDTIQGNSICGAGYTPPPSYVYAIDVTATNNPTVKKNTTCSTAGPTTTDPINNAPLAPATHGKILAHPIQ